LSLDLVFTPDENSGSNLAGSPPRTDWVEMYPSLSTAAPPLVLIVDDDPEIRAMVRAILTQHGFACVEAEGVGAAHAALRAQAFDLVLLDLGLGDGDGLDLCRRLRGEGAQPVLILSARADPIDRILGIEVGADDYLTKPFHPRELIARIRAILRRTHAQGVANQSRSASALGFAGWRLDLVRRELRRADGALVHLGAAEFEMLALLVERAQRVVSRDELFEALHGRLPDPEDRSIDLRISRLRRKIEIDPKQPAMIKTIRAEGFLFTEAVVPA
jgi:Response regulators consisting of a CheY-like receiver domain and a winged-helix DNA-binding domain